MLLFSHANLVFISGVIWLLVGAFLLQFGLKLLLEPAHGPLPFMEFIRQFTHEGDEAIVLIIAIALLVGFLKGRHVLRKAAERGIQHICTFPNPTSLFSIYSKRYCLLLLFMIALGMSMKYFNVPHDIRGAIDIAVGSALINGSFSYFRKG